MGRRRPILLGAGAIALGATGLACNALWGVDSLHYDSEGSSAVGAGGLGAGGSTHAGAGGEGGAAGGPPIDVCAPPIPGPCALYAAEACGYQVRCVPHVVEWTTGGPAECESLVAADCARRVAAWPGLLQQDPFTPCAEALSAAPCELLWASSLPEACRATSGPLPLDLPCQSHEECSSGVCHRDEGAGTCGMCAPRPALGEPCPDGLCDYGLACAKAECVAVSGLGDPCGEDTLCASNLSCARDAGSQLDAYRCVARGAAGADCDPFDDTLPECRWIEGLYCDISQGAAVCAPMEPRGPTESCVEPAQFCVAGLCSETGACVERAPSCQPCGGGGLCSLHSICVDGQCLPVGYGGCG